MYTNGHTHQRIDLHEKLRYAVIETADGYLYVRRVHNILGETAECGVIVRRDVCYSINKRHHRVIVSKQLIIITNVYRRNFTRSPNVITLEI